MSNLQQIENAFKENKLESGLQQLNEFAKAHQLTVKEKIKCSQLYHWYGDNTKAIKVLGTLNPFTPMDNLSSEEFDLYLRYSYLLSYVGAKYISLRILEHIEKECIRRKKDPHEFILSYTSTKAFDLLGRFKSKEALELFIRLRKKSPEQTLQFALAHISIADCYEALGKYHQAMEAIESYLKTSPSRNFKAISYQAMGEYTFRQEKYIEAMDFLNTSEKFFDEDKTSKDYSYLCLWKGATLVKMKQYKLAQSYLEQALSIHLEKKGRTEGVIPIFYWLNQLPKYQLKLDALIPLRNFYSFSPYHHLMGRPISDETFHGLPQWFQKTVYKSSHQTAWLIHKKSMSLYNPFHPLSKFHEILDLDAGVWIQNKKVNLLNSFQSRLLSAVASSGHLGVNDIGLADFVYRQDFTQIEYAQERIKKLVRGLTSKNLKIIRKKNHLFLERPEVIILPMNLESRGAWVMMGRHFPKGFSHPHVMELLSLSRAQAYRYLKEWLEQGFLTKENQVYNVL